MTQERGQARQTATAVIRHEKVVAVGRQADVTRVLTDGRHLVNNRQCTGCGIEMEGADRALLIATAMQFVYRIDKLFVWAHHEVGRIHSLGR